MATETVEKVDGEPTRLAGGACGEAPSDRRREWQPGPQSSKARATYRTQTEGSVSENRHERLLPLGSATDLLGVSRATIERLVYRGELPTVKVAGTTRYDVEDLDGYIDINGSAITNGRPEKRDLT